MKTLSTLLLALLSFFLSSSICNAFAFTPSPSRIGRKIVNVPKQNQINARRFISSPLFLSENDTNSIDEAPTVYTPADRPLLAVVDIVGLVIFALIGKSSHSADGSIDLSGVLTTAFPFVTAWLATSPLTGVYSPDDKGAMTTIIKAVLKGWAFAIPLVSLLSLVYSQQIMF